MPSAGTLRVVAGHASAACHAKWEPTSSTCGLLRCPGPGDVTVVIPVRDRHTELARLAGLSEQASLSDTPATPRPQDTARTVSLGFMTMPGRT